MIICTFTPILLTEVEMIEINQIRKWNEREPRIRSGDAYFIVTKIMVDKQFSVFSQADCRTLKEGNIINRIYVDYIENNSTQVSEE